MGTGYLLCIPTRYGFGTPLWVVVDSRKEVSPAGSSIGVWTGAGNVFQDGIYSVTYMTFIQCHVYDIIYVSRY